MSIGGTTTVPAHWEELGEGTSGVAPPEEPHDSAGWVVIWFVDATESISPERRLGAWLSHWEEWWPSVTSCRRGVGGEAAVTSDTASWIRDIRSISGLTWDQLSRVFGVSRRSVHLWAQGGRPAAENAERIGRVRAFMNRFNAGDRQATLNWLLTVTHGDKSPLDLLVEQRESELRTSPGVSRSRPPVLSREEHELRQGFSPLELLDARHDEPHVVGDVLGFAAVPGVKRHR